MEHADVTLMPGALSHIRHMIRDEACKAVVLGTLLNIRLHLFLKYLSKMNVAKMGAMVQFTSDTNKLHFII